MKKVVEYERKARAVIEAVDAVEKCKPDMACDDFINLCKAIVKLDQIDNAAAVLAIFDDTMMRLRGKE